MNLDNPWILARALTALVTAVVALYACRTAVRVLRRFRVGETSEGQVALARRAELVAATVEFALLGSLAGFALTIMVADRLSESIRGAMCAFGVFEATGREPLLTATASVIVCLAWRALHRADLELLKPTFTRHKFAAVLALTPILLIDLAAVLHFASELDLSVVSTCCSVSLDSGSDAARGGNASVTVFGGFVAAAVLASISFGLTTRRPAFAPLAVASSIVALVLAFPAVAGYVAPHIYETPNHQCAYCLLRAEGLYLGWPMLFTWLVALSRTVELAVGEMLGRSAPAASGPGRRRARHGAIAWALFLATAIVPIIRFAIASGGADLFLGAS